MALTAVSPESGNEFVDSFINNGRHYVNGAGVSGPFVINYYFGELTGTEIDGRNYGYTWRPIEKAAYRTAVQGWEHVANIKFNEVAAQADALFVERLENQATAGGTVSASHSLPSANAAAQSQGTYNFEAVNIRQWTPDTLEPGGNFFGRVAKILAGENCAPGRVRARSDGAISGPLNRLTDPFEAAKQAVGRHRNTRCGEDYFDR
ncbi:hypothetical protein DA075_34275 [Methylobacterium currus]|uniref:Uncharacterized protein n=1 Tax=Methylobacterium currus TaxID=2051553 RepID=A0A2R4WWL1_9HYPH|nr:hypothetical protein [Methylobacterium currus]AWB25890.1 hypothetical protein DA075_34275 [Methylobacterium currus]